jgi:hypothetical protein
MVQNIDCFFMNQVDSIELIVCMIIIRLIEIITETEDTYYLMISHVA